MKKQKVDKAEQRSVFCVFKEDLDGGGGKRVKICKVAKYMYLLPKVSANVLQTHTKKRHGRSGQDGHDTALCPLPHFPKRPVGGDTGLLLHGKTRPAD